MSKFNDVIEIEDNSRVNLFLHKLLREQKETEGQAEQTENKIRSLNSVFVNYLFSTTMNPSDSKISPKYVDSVHLLAKILMDFFDKNKSFSGGFNQFSKRIANLIDLVNAEKFDFEDLDAWKMGATMEQTFQDHWRKLGGQFSKIRQLFSDRIRQNEEADGKINSISEITNLVDSEKGKIIEDERIKIKKISELSLNSHFKTRLIQQLEDQINNESHDVKIMLIDCFRRHQHEMETQSGKFSMLELEKKINELIENEKSVKNITTEQIAKKFKFFWDEVMKDEKISELRKSLESTRREQLSKYRRNVKECFESCLHHDRDDIATLTKFKSVSALENWKFTEKQFLAIKVMDDEMYFWPRSFFNKAKQNAAEIFFHSDKKYGNLMADLLSQFKTFVDTNHKTKRNYDGYVDNAVILSLCREFQGVVKTKIEELQIKKYVKPFFNVTCIAFACYKLLLPRLEENVMFGCKTKDPVKEFESKRSHFQQLHQMKLQGAKRSELWQQKLVNALYNLMEDKFIDVDHAEETHEIVKLFYEERAKANNRNGSSRIFSIQVVRHTNLLFYLISEKYDLKKKFSKHSKLHALSIFNVHEDNE